MLRALDSGIIPGEAQGNYAFLKPMHASEFLQAPPGFAHSCSHSSISNLNSANLPRSSAHPLYENPVLHMCKNKS